MKIFWRYDYGANFYRMWEKKNCLICVLVEFTCSKKLWRKYGF